MWHSRLIGTGSRTKKNMQLQQLRLYHLGLVECEWIYTMYVLRVEHKLNVRFLEALHRPLQHTATRSTTLQHTATHCNMPNSNTPQHAATHCATLHHAATLYNMLQRTATHAPHCTTLHHTAHTASYRTTLHHTAPHCTTLQHTATHCHIPTHSTLQYIKLDLLSAFGSHLAMMASLALTSLAWPYLQAARHIFLYSGNSNSTLRACPATPPPCCPARSASAARQAIAVTAAYTSILFPVDRRAATIVSTLQLPCVSF